MHFKLLIQSSSSFDLQQKKILIMMLSASFAKPVVSKRLEANEQFSYSSLTGVHERSRGRLKMRRDESTSINNSVILKN